MYTELAAWHNEHGSSLEILLYPSDEFGRQELQSNKIAPFLKKTFGLEMGSGVQLMQKVNVNGANADPVWVSLKAAFPGDVGWNFAVRARFGLPSACAAAKRGLTKFRVMDTDSGHFRRRQGGRSCGSLRRQESTRRVRGAHGAHVARDPPRGPSPLCFSRV